MGEKQRMTEKINTDLKNAILAQSTAVGPLLDNLVKQVEEIDQEEARRLTKVYITGCGDSYFAGVAGELAFHKYAAVDVQPVEALNFSRYLAPYMPDDSLLVAISNSGRVSRTIEAARAARMHRKAWGITDNPDSPLAASVDRVLAPGIPSIRTGGTGTISYLASLLALYATAVGLGRKRGALGEAEVANLLDGLRQTSELIDRTLDLCGDAVAKFAHDLPADTLYFVGGGPNYGTALYGAAKVMEALSLSGVAVELEEWAHLEFHTTGPDTYYVMISPPGASHDRAIEQAKGIRDSGGRLAAVLDRRDSELAELCEWTFPVDSPSEEALSPLVYGTPLQLLAVELAMARNLSMKMRLDEHRKEVNFRQIFHSQIVNEA